MKSNVQNSPVPENMRELDNTLSNLEISLKEIITSTIGEINKNPALQKEFLGVFANHANNVTNFFFEECERTDNKGLYKDILKYVMFKRK